MNYLSITEAASFSGKSIQTIRRMIKAKKVAIKKNKTPQGFVYLIDKASLEKSMQSPILFFQDKKSENLTTDTQTSTQTDTTRVHAGLTNELEKFNTTMQKLIEQNERDKDNFFGLIKTFQDRIFVLENQIKLLEAPKKSWWSLW